LQARMCDLNLINFIYGDILMDHQAIIDYGNLTLKLFKD